MWNHVESVLTETRASQGTRQTLRASVQNLTLPDFHKIEAQR